MIAQYIGIDVAKDNFMVAYKEDTVLLNKVTFSNNAKGIRQFIASIPPSAHCIMEATGVYSMRLALSLHKKGFFVSVVNPLQIKRFAQTKLKRTKTDSVDAELIAEYGERMSPDFYQPPPFYISILQQQRTALQLVIKTKLSFSNQLHALRRLPKKDSISIEGCKAIISSLDTERYRLEEAMEQTINEHCHDLFMQLQSIPGISKKSAIELIIVSGAFKNFSSAKQFSAYIGVCPCINESGSSIRGYKGISRMGDKGVRNMLFMCSLMAKQCNLPCKALYDRMVASGKPKKVALLAVVNKLVKQVFGVVNSGSLFVNAYPQGV